MAVLDDEVPSEVDVGVTVVDDQILEVWVFLEEVDSLRSKVERQR